MTVFVIIELHMEFVGGALLTFVSFWYDCYNRGELENSVTQDEMIQCSKVS